MANALLKLELEDTYRIVVSSPDAYNNATREFLEELGIDSKFVTILSAYRCDQQPPSNSKGGRKRKFSEYVGVCEESLTL